jgi:glycosyltransferase involved in cell wall biosynthesis
MQPLVTIITPCYNHEKYLDDYFQSLLSQTYYNIELIILDDGSTDSSWKKICSYKVQLEKRFRRVICDSQVNVGFHRALARALSLAQGEYLSILESDDYYLLNKIEENVKYFQSHPEVGLVHSDTNFVYPDRIEEGHWKASGAEIPVGSVFEKLLVANFITTCSVCMRVDLLKKHVDFDKYKLQGYLMADYPMWLDLARHTHFGYIDKPLADYRILQESACHSQDPRKTLRFFKSTCQVRFDYARKNNVPQKTEAKVVDRMVKELFDWFIYPYCYEKEYAAARLFLKYALQLKPTLLRDREIFRMAGSLFLKRR